MERIVQSSEYALIVTHSLGTIGLGDYELAYLWLPISGTLVLQEVELRSVGVAKALYRNSGNSELAMDWQSSGPPWFLDALPLRFQPKVWLNGREETDISHLIRQAETVNTAAIDAWTSSFGAIPTTSL